MKIDIVTVNDPFNPVELKEWYDAHPDAQVEDIKLVLSYVFYIFYIQEIQMATSDPSSYVLRFNEIAQSIEYSTGSSWYPVPTSGGLPAGVYPQVQYNNGGSFGADAGFYRNPNPSGLFLAETGGSGGATLSIKADNGEQAIAFGPIAGGTRSVETVRLATGGHADGDTEFASTGNFSFLDFADSGHVTEPSAQVEIFSTTKGFLPSRLTTTEKNAIAAPAIGLVVYDSTLNKLCVFTGAVWETITSA